MARPATSFPPQVITSGITRGVYHRLDISAKFLDGTANDAVEYALDGVPLANLLGGMTFGTFEGWRDGLQFTYALTNRLFFRSGAPPEQLWRIRRHDRPGLLLRRPVLRRREPVRRRFPAGRLRNGVRAGLLRRFNRGPGSVVRRNNPSLRESVDQTVDLSGLNQRPGTGDSRNLEQHLIGQHQRGLRRVGVRPAPPRCPPASHHRGPAPICRPRRCGSAPQVQVADGFDVNE